MKRDDERRGRLIGVAISLAFHLVLVAFVLSHPVEVRQILTADASSNAVATGAPRVSAAFLRPGQQGVSPSNAIQLYKDRSEPAAPVSQFYARWRPRPLAIGTFVDHLWQSTLFAAFAGLLTIVFRRNSARVRYCLWLGASIKFLVPLALLSSLGSHLAPATIQRLAQHPLVVEIRQPFVDTGLSAIWPAPSPPDEAGLGWRGLALLAVWACGSVAIAATRVRAWRRLRAIVRTSTPMALPGLDIPAPVEVRSAPGLLEPGVIGWRHPVLLMPADIERHLTRPEIEAIVAHELCHIRRYDNITAAMHMVVEALFWFHPFVWWMGGRLVDERERACDEYVVRTFGEPRLYAQGIVNVCKRYVESPLASVSGVSSSNVRKRVDAILANQMGEAIGPLKQVVLSTAIALMVIVPLGLGAASGPPFDGQLQRVALVPSLAGGARRAQAGGGARMTAYALVVADADGRLGPRLTRSSRTDCDAFLVAQRCGGQASPGTISADSVTLSDLADLIGQTVNRRVDDRTGLTGRFNVRFTWTFDPNGPSIFTAMQEQLGLRLVPVAVADDSVSRIQR